MNLHFHHRSAAERGKAAFTLIELLTVIAIIAILVTILWAAVRKAINDAKEKFAAAEMREIVNASIAYLQQYEKLPVPEEHHGGDDQLRPYSGASATPVYQILAGDNPLEKVFLDRQVTGPLLDPWGTSYILWFDLNYSGDTTYVNTPSDNNTVSGARVVVRSYGRNRTSDDVDYKTSDDILVY
ncbi:MAG: type II secretion system protein [Lentisphaerae bacterium]|nr:type II secretion system protein [Lentisphaerota bacterium]